MEHAFTLHRFELEEASMNQAEEVSERYVCGQKGRLVQVLVLISRHLICTVHTIIQHSSI